MHKHNGWCTRGLDAEGRLDHFLPIRPEGECWLWQGSLNQAGYGVGGMGGKQYRAHRLAYETWVGAIPDGLVLDHVRGRGCHSRHCCNPAHLQPVTSVENVQRGDSPAMLSARRLTCKNGHLFDATRTVGERVYRACSTCRKEAAERQEARKTRERRGSAKVCQGPLLPVGVTRSGDGKFRSRVMLKGQEMRLGVFASSNHAYKARAEAEASFGLSPRNQTPGLIVHPWSQ